MFSAVLGIIETILYEKSLRFKIDAPASVTLCDGLHLIFIQACVIGDLSHSGCLSIRTVKLFIGVVH